MWQVVAFSAALTIERVVWPCLHFPFNHRCSFFQRCAARRWRHLNVKQPGWREERCIVGREGSGKWRVGCMTIQLWLNKVILFIWKPGLVIVDNWKFCTLVQAVVANQLWKKRFPWTYGNLSSLPSLLAADWLSWRRWRRLKIISRIWVPWDWVSVVDKTLGFQHCKERGGGPGFTSRLETLYVTSVVHKAGSRVFFPGTPVSSPFTPILRNHL